MSPSGDDSKELALTAAGKILDVQDWDQLTAAKIAEQSNFSRQWLHSLFGSQPGLVAALVAHLVEHWAAQQLQLLADVTPGALALERCLDALVAGPARVGKALRYVMTAPPAQFAAQRATVTAMWARLWTQRQQETTQTESAMSVLLLNGVLGLEHDIRAGSTSPLVAKRALRLAVAGYVAEANKMIEPVLFELPELKFVGKVITTTNAAAEADGTALWRDIEASGIDKLIQHKVDPSQTWACQIDWHPTEPWRYLVADLVAQVADVPEGLIAFSVPAYLWASFAMPGRVPNAEHRPAYDSAEKWLPRSSFKWAQNLTVMHFDNVQATGELLVPLRKPLNRAP